MGHPQPLFRLFSVFFKQTIQFLQQMNVKKYHVHPVSGAGIRTHEHGSSFASNTNAPKLRSCQRLKTQTQSKL